MRKKIKIRFKNYKIFEIEYKILLNDQTNSKYQIKQQSNIIESCVNHGKSILLMFDKNAKNKSKDNE